MHIIDDAGMGTHMLCNVSSQLPLIPVFCVILLLTLALGSHLCMGVLVAGIYVLPVMSMLLRTDTCMHRQKKFPRSAVPLR